jgi:hypothetical protein
MDVTIDCVCPPKGDAVRHPDGDTVKLRERLDFHAATTIRHNIALLYQEDGETSGGEILALLTEHYLLFGVEGWSLVDEKGKPVEVSKPTIRERLFGDPIASMLVGDAADLLYSEQVMLPLMERASRSSPTTSTDESTSPTKASSPKRPKPSKPSSISTIPTVATETTSSSLDGDSSSSQSVTSAA